MKVDILIVPDIHVPFEAPWAVRELQAFAALSRPRVTVFLGDLWDEYLLSRFPKNPETLDRRTIREGKKRGLKILQGLQNVTTEKVYLIPGNHEDRLQARLAESPMLSWWLGPQRQETPEGIEWVHARELALTTKRGSVYFTHGWRTREFAGHAAASMVRDRSVVTGHTHKLGLIWRTDKHFAIEAGWLGDERKYAFGYKLGKGSGCFDWARGFAWIGEDGDPRIERLS